MKYLKQTRLNPRERPGNSMKQSTVKKRMCEYQASKLAEERVVGIENKLNFIAPLLGAKR